jgi:hypothetical protein
MLVSTTSKKPTPHEDAPGQIKSLHNDHEMPVQHKSLTATWHCLNKMSRQEACSHCLTDVGMLPLHLAQQPSVNVMAVM